MGIRDRVPPGALLAIDTAPFIYYIEATSSFDHPVVELFDECVAAGRNPAVTSVITLTEVLVGAVGGGRRDLARRYRELLGHSDNLTLLTISPDVAERAAEVRVRHGLRLPDAFQVAAALVAGAAYLITNDVALKRVEDLEVVVLAELER